MITFTQITDSTSADFDDAMEIYSEAFPPNERHSIDIIKKRLEQSTYEMFVGHKDKEVVFMALLYPLNETDFVLFDYMATKKEFRNEGIGSKYVQYLFDTLVGDYNKYLLLEVENPECGDNKDVRLRRVNFYKRLGIKQLSGVRYILPPLSGNKHTEMILMVYPDYKEEAMSGELVKKIIVKLYKELYQRDEDDELLNTFIKFIPDKVKTN